jgi:hypothetical protein
MKPAIILFLFAATTAGLPASTIVGVDGATGGFGVGIFPSQAIAVSFSVDQSYSDVSIGAFLDGAFVGAAFLTSGIGAGTTVADQFDTASFTAVGTGETTLFDGIDLDPGTYYLILSSSTKGGTQGIWGTATPTVTTDIGASAVAGYYTANNPTGYIPADLGNFHTGDSLEFDVTTPDAAPEPAAWTMLLPGLLLVAALRIKAFSFLL